MKTLFSFEPSGSPVLGRGALPEQRRKAFAISVAAHIAAFGLLLTARAPYTPAVSAPNVRYQITKLYAPPVKSRIQPEQRRRPVREPVIQPIKPPVAPPVEVAAVTNRVFVPPQAQGHPKQQIRIEETPQLSAALPQVATVIPPIMAKLTLPRAIPPVDFDGADGPVSRHRRAGGTTSTGSTDGAFDSGTGLVPGKGKPSAHGAGATEAPIDDLGSGLAPAHGGAVATSPVARALTPVQIIHMPDAVYTQEARTAKIEGTVLVRVLFHATGKVEVLGVVNKLGHGLDEVACAIAEGIVFKPAKIGAIPVDHVTTVGVVFSLAI